MSKFRWIIAGDIINSKNIDDRENIQNKLENTLSGLNKKFADNTVNGFNITLGDEFIGIINEPAILMEIILTIIFHLKEINIRFGLSIINNLNEKEKGIKKVKQAIEVAKENNYPVYFNTVNIVQNQYMTFISLSLFLMVYHFQQLSKKQKVILYYLLKNKKQIEIAEQLKISQAAVSQAVKKINWKLLKKLYQKFKFLNQDHKKSSDHDDEYLALVGQWELREISKVKIEKLLDEINQKFQNSIAAKFVLTVPVENKGHELQGLMNKKNHWFDIIFELFIKIKSLILGLGSGSLTTEKKKLALGMDGPVFYHARTALNEANKEKWQLKYKEDNKFISEYAAIILLLLLNFIKQWTEKQIETVILKRKDLTQREVAERLKISRTAVTNRLARADWKAFSYIEKQVDLII